MRRYLIGLVGILVCAIGLFGCGKKDVPALVFATSAEYPPFEFYDGKELKGFDIDLGRMVAAELGMKAEFKDMPFGSVLIAVRDGRVDAAIATLTITPERAENFDFSHSYYYTSLASLYKESRPITSAKDMEGKRIACQAGTVMEGWLKANVQNVDIVDMGSNARAVEALKNDQVACVILDGVQGSSFVKNNTGLGYSIVATSTDGYGIAVQRGSSLKVDIDRALLALESRGELQKLREKWIG